MEIDADCNNNEREGENEIRTVHRYCNTHTEAEKIRMGHHGENEGAVRVNTKGLSVIATAPRVSDKAEFRIALARHEQRTEKPPRQNDRQWGKNIRGEQRKPAEPKANGIVERLRNHVEIGTILEPDRFDMGHERFSSSSAREMM